MAENGETFTELLNSIVDDHLHWRRNYYPQDGALFSAHDRRQSAEQSDDLEDAMRVLLAKLRRSFPFHSPRYLAHQQSEISMPSVLGAIAGMLYNSNNVTSESGHATIELEMEATADLLQMIGYRPPPMPPHLPATQAQLAAYWDAAREAVGMVSPLLWRHYGQYGGTLGGPQRSVPHAGHRRGGAQTWYRCRGRALAWRQASNPGRFRIGDHFH